jgi:hypothetical protein
MTVTGTRCPKMAHTDKVHWLKPSSTDRPDFEREHLAQAHRHIAEAKERIARQEGDCEPRARRHDARGFKAQPPRFRTSSRSHLAPAHAGLTGLSRRIYPPARDPPRRHPPNGGTNVPLKFPFVKASSSMFLVLTAWYFFIPPGWDFLLGGGLR